MNEGVVSTELGLKGMPTEAEDIMVHRDISLLPKTGGRLHVAHIRLKQRDYPLPVKLPLIISP